MSRGGERDVLDAARGVGAMTTVIAIMLFLTVLAAALGLATRNAAAALDRRLAGRMTVQLADEATAARVAGLLAGAAGVARVTPVPREELARLLSPWLGSDAADPDLPMPALIDVDLDDASDAAADRLAARVRAAAPDARIDRQAAWMSPVARVLDTLTWLAAALVVLMAGTTGLVVVLAARAGLDAHRGTIEVMHMLGSTDVQLARLFQRRIARDAATGGIAGAALALATIALLGSQAAALGSELIAGVSLGTGGWIALALLPLGFIVLAAVAARVAVLARLRQTL